MSNDKSKEEDKVVDISKQSNDITKGDKPEWLRKAEEFQKKARENKKKDMEARNRKAIRLARGKKK